MNWSTKEKEDEPQRKTRKVASENATTILFVQGKFTMRKHCFLSHLMDGPTAQCGPIHIKFPVVE